MNVLFCFVFDVRPTSKAMMTTVQIVQKLFGIDVSAKGQNLFSGNLSWFELGNIE